jgi:hypothetical protein
MARIVVTFFVAIEKRKKKKKAIAITAIALFIATEPKREGKELKGRSLPSSSHSGLSVLAPT